MSDSTILGCWLSIISIAPGTSGAHKISEKEIEKNSMNKLKNEEMKEILTECLGRKITEEELPNLLEKMKFVLTILLDLIYNIRCTIVVQ